MAQFLTDEIDFESYMRETDAQAKVKPANSYTAALKARLRGRKNERMVYLPWEKTQKNFDFRYGEVTIWAGQNGHGKSQVTSMVALSLMGQGEKVCIASFEMKPVMTLQRMARMYCGTNPYAPEYQGHEGMAALDAMYDEFGQWSDGLLWLYDQNGTTEAQKVIGMAKYCASELGIKQIFIDNLAKCIRAEDDYNGQKSFVDECTAIAKDFDVHVHLVHHLKKPNKETDIPDKHDVKGSGTIVDQPDNLMQVWRNKGKEEDRKAGKNQKTAEPDMVIFCRKQRNYEGSDDGEPNISLWFDRDSGQFLESEHGTVLYFPNFPHRRTEF